jgi:hypothetical protein
MPNGIQVKCNPLCERSAVQYGLPAHRIHCVRAARRQSYELIAFSPYPPPVRNSVDWPMIGYSALACEARDAIRVGQPLP